MKRLVAVTAALCIVLGLLAAPASATPAVPPTIAGPGQVPYWSTVTLTGTAGQDATVTVYFRDTAGGTFRAERNVTADASGNYSTTYTAGNDYEYYAVANGVPSPIRRTAIVGATCTTSGPAFRTLPVPNDFPDGDPAYAAFTATRNGAWAGVAAGVGIPGGEYAIITWHPGDRTPSIVQRYTYTSWNPGNSGGSVDVVGITPTGGVVAAVQRVSTTYDDHEYVGLAWLGRHRYELAHSSTWSSFAPVGISDNGAIAGWARIGSPTGGQFYVVRWAGPTAPYQVLAKSPEAAVPGVTIDAAGDVAYSFADTAVVRSPSGTVRTLAVPPPLPPGSAYITAGAGPYVYGSASAGVLSWAPGANTSDPVPSEEIGPNSQLPVAAGPRGDVVLTDFHHAFLRTAPGGETVIGTIDDNRSYDGNTIAADGTTSNTAANGLIYFLRCPQPNGSAGRAGRSDVVADVNGDHRADLLATKPDGTLWYWPNTGNGTHPYASGAQISSGWTGFATILAGDVNGDGHADLLATKTDGTLWYWPNTGSATAPYGAGHQIGSGWAGFTTILAGDVNGDGHADLLATKPDGTLWYWPNTGSATAPFGAGHQIGSGWTDFTTLTLGDLNGDHGADLIAVSPNGELAAYLNTGNPNAPYASGTEIGVSGWTGPTHLAAGDVNGDGLADLLATSPAGALDYYPNSGTTDAPFTSGAQVGSGWQSFNRLF
ncbi:MAG TPA: VCBS repeat-containing protein [Jatrophihabitans sp.]|nr:VCBS repeat-containing protein [Jatrophihabitans sp.]